MIIPHRPIDYYREYYVSLWVGQFASVDEVDAYFTEDYGPDHWKPSPFAIELGLGYYPPEYLEIHFFEEMAPRPLLTFLMEPTFSESFLHAALAAARDQGIYEAQGIALLFNFDYQSKSNWAQTVGPMRFIGTFAFEPGSVKAIYHEVAERAGCSIAALWFVLAAFRQFEWERRNEQGKEGPASAREFCAFLQSAQAKTTAEIIQWWIPRRIAADLSTIPAETTSQAAPPPLPMAPPRTLAPSTATTPSPTVKSAEPVPPRPLVTPSEEAIPSAATGKPVEPPQESVTAILRALRLPRSEDVGRVIYALVSAGILGKHESDSKADFHGLFNLEE